MNNSTQNSHTRPHQPVRVILLTLALLTSPALCCGAVQLLDALPSSWLPASLSSVVNLFESSVSVQNKTSHTYYVTAVSTSFGDPRVIPQYSAFRQRDIPLPPNSSITLQYDAADLPLSAIVVCRTAQDCRQVPARNSDIYELSSYESLEALDPAWLESIAASPLYNYGSLMIGGLGLASILFFAGWVYFTQRGKTRLSRAKGSLT